MPANDPHIATSLSLKPTKFSGPTEFAEQVRLCLSVAATEGWSEMVWSDGDFMEWPLRESAVTLSLHAWAKKGRRLTLLARNYDAVLRHHPRFVQWRETWSHLVDCRVCKGVEATDFVSAMWSPVWAMRRLDLERSTGLVTSEPQSRLQLRELLNEYLRNSSPGCPATTLGL
jgi:hypothetical protein